jgi:predicted GNAT family N-acyltransferase
MAMDNITLKLVTNDEELRSALEVRRQVFVQEQGVSEDLEYDGYDDEALHMVVRDEERVIGTARVRFLTTNQAKIERIAILKPFRRRGIGSSILSFLKIDLKNRQIKHVVLHAQYAVTAFYKSCGFVKIGSPFWEDGIKHIKMQLWL